MECKFVIDQKVVCIADGWEDGWDDTIFPEKNKIYTIRGISMLRSRKGIVPSLWFHEIVNQVKVYNGAVTEPAFDFIGFKPLDELHKGMEILNEIRLDPAVKINAPEGPVRKVTAPVKDPQHG